MLSLLKKLTGSTHEPPPPPDEFEKSISPELIKKIRDIQVKTNHLVNHMMSGEYVSAFKGRGMEFSEVREYEPGDDVRLIDWNVTARMGHPYIKELSRSFGKSGNLRSCCWWMSALRVNSDR